MLFRRQPTTPPTAPPMNTLTDNQLAGHLDQLAEALTTDGAGDAAELVADAARRLRRGGGVSITNSRAKGNIIATSVNHRYDR